MFDDLTGEETTQLESQGELLPTGEPEQQPEGDPPAEDPTPDTNTPEGEAEAQAGYLRDADYRKKTMALADERREFETKQRDTAAQAYKWQRFESDPAYREAVIAESQRLNGQANGTATTASVPAGPDLSQFDPEHLEIVRHVAREMINEMVIPKMQQGEQAIQAMQSEKVGKAWSDLKTKYPQTNGSGGVEAHQQEILSFLTANPGVKSLEQAYFAVAGPDLLSKRQVLAKKQDSVTRRDAQVTSTSISSAGTVPTTKMTLAEIVQEEIDKQRA